jgi:hypothetical protein
MTVQLFCFLTDPSANDHRPDGSYFEGNFTTRREARKYAQEQTISWIKVYGLTMKNDLRWQGDEAFLGEDRAFKIEAS